jgi:hypothetical protein
LAASPKKSSASACNAADPAAAPATISVTKKAALMPSAIQSARRHVGLFSVSALAAEQQASSLQQAMAAPR